MEKGNMRLEPNISLSGTREEKSGKLPPYKVEVKNINSFRFVEKAINFEIARHEKMLDSGEDPKQETRGWNENKNETVSQRSKEDAHDYRYFPEPDIPPIHFTEDQIEEIKKQIPELPIEKTERYVKEFGISYYDAEILTRDFETSVFFEKAVELGKPSTITPKQIANAIINKKADLKKPEQDLIKQIADSSQVVEIDENELKSAVEKALAENSQAVTDYKSGKIQVLGFLIGQVKKQLPKADTNQIKTSIEQALK
jgi:aspartyl-tRNA(Asn)/glutamyl-tRNA(Gln) amidotransferase subunit B